MTDRAVVELSEHICTRCGYRHPVGMEGGSCLAAARVEIEPSPPPRALVALSDDRQWLVVPHPEEEDSWLFAQLRTSYNPYIDNTRVWYEGTVVWDNTGQDAQEVLEQFLKEHNHA